MIVARGDVFFVFVLASMPGLCAADVSDGRNFWSFQPIATPRLPELANESRVHSPIDRFVLARLQERGLRPGDPADRRTLIRRVTMDLIGLPATAEEVSAFVEDDAPDAFSKVLDRLLASPQHGERWARYWLDVARYGGEQTNEGHASEPLPSAYRYRDWVVGALNRNLPYDQFVMYQIAGDLIEGAGHGGMKAVGFLALGPIYEADAGDEASKRRARYDTIDEKVDTLSRTFLGLTLACARCHEHKFDPIPQQDYYSIAGVFYNTKYVEQQPLVSMDIVERYLAETKPIRDLEERLRSVVTEKFKTIKKRRQEENKQEPEVADVARLKAEVGKLVLEEKRLSAELETLRKAAPPVFSHAHSVADEGREDIRVAIRGNPERPGEVAPRRFLRIIAGDDPPRFTRGSGRLELARAIASPSNPMTARVIVNRIWLGHFGEGIVRTPSNFGSLGERPTHPLLLDWLASRLIGADWSIKQLHRDIMLSGTYGLSSGMNAQNHSEDGGNRLLWRMSPRQLDVEAWRDSLLAVSGELDPQLGGPSVDDILVSRRRTIYALIRRDSHFAPDRFLRMFGLPDARTSSGLRAVTTVAPQQLFALNSKFITVRARALARRVTAYEGERERIFRAFELVFARRPSDAEMRLALGFLGESRAATGTERMTRWEQYAQVLLASNELFFLE